MKDEFKTTEKNLKIDKNNNSIKTNDRETINMSLKDDSNFLSVFSKTETMVINSEVANFLENQVQAFKPNQLLTLNVTTNCVDDNEKEEYKKAIKEYYSQRYFFLTGEIKRNYLIAYVLFFIGFIILALSVFMQINFNSAIWSEVIDIMAWVFLWEAIDIIAFKTKALRVEKKRCVAFVNMNVNFIEGN